MYFCRQLLISILSWRVLIGLLSDVMAGYGTARTFAEHLGHADAARLLQMTLDEERETDKLLTQIAEQNINYKAEWTQQ